MDKGFIKTISQIVSIILTVASSVVLMLALGTIDIEKWSWGAFFIFIAAVAWITYVLWDFDRKNTKKERK